MSAVKNLADLETLMQQAESADPPIRRVHGGGKSLSNHDKALRAIQYLNAITVSLQKICPPGYSKFEADRDQQLVERCVADLRGIVVRLERGKRRTP